MSSQAIRMRAGLLFFGLALLVGASSFAFAEVSADCLRTRAVIDIGSGSTKLRVARVDTCLQRVVQALTSPSNASRPVSYKADLQASPDRRFSDAIVARGAQAIQELKALALEMGATEVRGIATAAFRQAENAPAVAERLSEQTGVRIRIISQRDEALLGYHGVLGVSEVPRERIVVWDIGGGSMQITAVSSEGELLVYEGLMAAETFKRALISRVQGRDPAVTLTPNPISAEDFSRATPVLAQAAGEVPSGIRTRLADSQTMVYGIGGVHDQSVRNQTGAPDGIITREVLARTIQANLGRTDAEIPNQSYATTEVSNLILVHGFMEALGISTIHALPTSVADGALVDPRYW